MEVLYFKTREVNYTGIKSLRFNHGLDQGIMEWAEL